MIIQTNIDKNDLIEARRGSRRGVVGAMARLFFGFILLSVVTVYAAFAFYRALTEFARDLNQPLDGSTAEQAQAFAETALPVFVALVGLCLVGILWRFLYRRWRAFSNRAQAGVVKHGLTTGKCIIESSETHLVVKTPLKVQKIAWSVFDSFEETKTSLIFHYVEGGFEFIPKTAVYKKGAMEKICAELKRRIETPLSRAEPDGAAGLTLAYEFTDADEDDLNRWRRREQSKSLSLFGRLIASPALIAATTGGFALLSAIALAGAVARLSMPLFIAAFLYGAIAAVLALTHPQMFAGMARRIRRGRQKGFAVTNPTTVTFSKTAVFYECRGVKDAYQWDAFDGVAQTDRAVYLVLSSARAIAVPKRAFIDQTHYDRVIGYVTVRLSEIKKAQNTTQLQRLQKSATAISAKPAAARRKTGQSDPSKSNETKRAPVSKRAQRRRLAPAG